MHTSLMQYLVLICLLLITGLAGCRKQAPMGDVSVVQPKTIQVDGVQWTKVEWHKKIDAQVASHFRKFPLLVDNPSLGGEPVCYSNGDTRRVYWLSAVEETCHWAMVEFKRSRGSELLEGTGAPFSEWGVDTQ